MSRISTLVAFAMVLAIATSSAPALAAEEFFSAKLRGGNETPLTISTAGTGVWAAQLDSAETTLTYVLSYDALEGGTVTAAHIHLGQPGITGGIVIHFCGTGGKPACPAPPGLISATATSADVVAVPTQGIAAGEFAEVVRAMRRGDTYVNVHTTTYPGGEIRGPIH